MKKILNFEYGAIHGTYWMFYGVVGSFASVFLLAKGYTNTDIGIILALGSILAVVMQPLVADFADRTKRITLIGILQAMAVMMMAMTAGLYIFQGKSLVLTIIFIMLTAWVTVVQPLANTLSFKLEKSGIPVNFGLCRSLGSLAYAALTAFLGTLVEKFGSDTIPISGAIILVLFLTSLYFTKYHYHKACRISIAEEKLQEGQEIKQNLFDEEEVITLIDFVKGHKLFILMNIGIVGIYFNNAVLNNFMMQIVADVGGTSEDMGRIFSIMAALEIPTLIFFNQIRKKFRAQTLIKVASAGFIVKMALCYVAKSVTMIFVAQFIQPISFALMLPSMVYFINETMKKGEAVKGQSIYTMMITVGTVFASLLGGVILDMSGAKTLCLIATIVTAVGAAIIFITVDKVKKLQ